MEITAQNGKEQCLNVITLTCPNGSTVSAHIIFQLLNSGVKQIQDLLLLHCTWSSGDWDELKGWAANWFGSNMSI